MGLRKALSLPLLYPFSSFVPVSDQREVSFDEVGDFASKNNLEAMETSALENTNVDEAFEKLIKEAYLKLKVVFSITYRHVNRLINQLINKSIIQSINQSANQSIYQSIN